MSAYMLTCASMRPHPRSLATHQPACAHTQPTWRKMGAASDQFSRLVIASFHLGEGMRQCGGEWSWWCTSDQIACMALKAMKVW